MKKFCYHYNLLRLLVSVLMIIGGGLSAHAQSVDASKIIGANFIPSTAVNQLEMWQQESFDPVTIDRELGWAEGIGMNAMRVYLHHVAWLRDPKGFEDRMGRFLAIADKHGIRIIFVFFDDCWGDSYKPGKQPEPVPSVHNSQWLKDPGGLIDSAPLLMDTLEVYVKEVMKIFSLDKRVLMWDLYNEPGHFGRGEKSFVLLKNVVKWAREVKASQPITIGIWNPKFTEFNRFSLEHSDVISFHNYQNTVSLKGALDTLVGRGKSVICTEYMKRPNGSTFQNCLPIFERYRVGAINWGLVAGKTQTNYPQGNKGGEEEPEIWYHDIFRKDGRPYDQEEIDFLRKLPLYDGPYVFHINGKRIAKSVMNDKVITEQNPEIVKVAFAEHPEWNFSVPLRSKLENEPDEFKGVKKLLVLSDIEGEFEAFRALLLANKVIDQQYRWTFGEGHLVIDGDLFDRGLYVTEYLWLLYKLEDEAKKKGGYVHVILGNHDIMNLSGDLRYLKSKYLKSAGLMGLNYMQCYDEHTELGRWLRTKNVVERLDDKLFMHAGLSPEVYALRLSLHELNSRCRPYYSVAQENLPDSIKVVFGKNSPFWYRGYFNEPKITIGEINQTLDYYQCSLIVVGHTIADKNIAFYYNGKVLGVDVDEHLGKRAAALYTKGKWFAVDDKGKRRKIGVRI